MKWFKPWMPKNTLPEVVREVSQHISYLGEQLYAYSVEYNEQLEEDEFGPRVTMLCWAGSDSSAKHALEHDVNESNDAAVDFSNINGIALPSLKFEDMHGFESATYDSNGFFVHVSVKNNNLTFLFKNREVVGSELPYAIINE